MKKNNNLLLILRRLKKYIIEGKYKVPFYGAVKFLNKPSYIFRISNIKDLENIEELVTRNSSASLFFDKDAEGKAIFLTIDEEDEE